MMIDQRHIVLMNQELDGENTAAESAELAEYLSVNREAESYFQGLKSVSDLFSRVKRVEPPTHLKAQILDAVRLSTELETGPGGILAAVREWFRQERKVHFAYGVALGLLVGVIAVAMFDRQGKIESDGLHGSVGLPQSSGRFVEIDRITLQHPGLSGSVLLKSSEQHIEFVFDLQAASPFSCTVDFEDYVVPDYASLGSDMEVIGNAIRLPSISKKPHLLLFQRKVASTPALFRIRVESTEGIVFEKVMSVGTLTP